MKYRYVECRALGHSWDQVEDDRTWRQFGVACQFRCTRCYTVRRDVISPATGELLYRSYSKPDDYALGSDQVGGAFNRADWRFALLANRKSTRRRKPKLKLVEDLA
jgi:hypothetical protein